MEQSAFAYSRSQGINLLQAAVERYGSLFTLEEIQRVAVEQGLNRQQIVNAASALARSGWLEIVKRGVYLVKSPLFAGEVHPFAVAVSLASPSAVSHWSALAHHGFTTQLPRMVQVSTPSKVVTPEMRQGQAYRPRGRATWKAGGVEVEFIHVTRERFFGHQMVWVNRWRQVAVTDSERAALDLIARADLFGGMGAALEILEGALSQIRVEQLVNYALRYNEGSTIKRLGWALEQFGVSSEIIEPLRALSVKTSFRLDPRGQIGGKHNARWRVVENLHGGSNG